MDNPGISAFSEWRCQTKTIGSVKTTRYPTSSSKLTPFGEGGGAIELEICTAAEVALLIEVVVY